jgi:hypothetical protein
MMKMVNIFGKQGCFEVILNRIENKEDPIPFELLSNYIEIISKPWPMYYNKFSSWYIPRICKAVKSCLLDAPEMILRDVRRETIEAIIKSLDILLKRVETSEKRQQFTDTLKMDVALMCLKSKFMERRIQGIRALNSSIRGVKNMNSIHHNKVLADLMRDHNTFQEIFSIKTCHLQVV